MMKKIILLTLLSLTYLFSNAQVIINEIEVDAGNNEGTGGDWIEFKNIGTNPEDMSCWRLTNGGSVVLSFPAGLVLPAGSYLLVGNSAKMMCATCDYKSMSSLFTLNANGYGPGSGAYSNTIFLNTDLAINGGCGCLTGSGNFNNGSGLGDRVMLFTDGGAIVDMLKYAGGNNYTAASLNVNFPSTSTCSLNTVTIPDASDPIYDGHTVCNDLSGCNSSIARLPDGNNGAIVTYDQSGNLACTNCTFPCASGATTTASCDIPTPGLSNDLSATSWNATINGNPVTTAVTTLAVCGATPLTFTYVINNFTNVALTATQASGNYGSYVSTNGGAPVNFAGTNYNATTGVTTMATTVTPPNGTTTYEFVWGDGNVNCTSCPGSNSVATPTNPTSTESECYVSRKIIVSRENGLGGTPNATCSLPGTITVNGATGTNLQYTLQKQTTVGGIFTTVSGPQSSNILGGIIDDDADPLLPNYQVLVSTNNLACPNPTPLVVAVPNSCLGNPSCPQYVTSGAGAPTFTPATGSTACANSSVQFSVDIRGVCTTGQLQVLYDYDPTFDPYTSGTLLGTAGTTVGVTPPTTTATGKVFINEFVPRPAAGTCTPLGITPNGASPNSGEWIELYNAGPGFVDISGWIVADGDWTATIPAGIILNAGTYYLIGGGGTLCSSGVLPDLNIETCNCANVSPVSQDIMNLTDGGEQIALFDCSGTFIDGVYWNAGQGLPDTTANTAKATGCGDYILQKNVNIPAIAGLTSTGSSMSGTNQGRYRTSTNTWTTTNNTTVLPTPKAANAGGNWTGTTIPFGTQCPPPPVTSQITVNLPDTCSQTSSTNVTLKAIYVPAPVFPCTKADVTATATFTIPPCAMLSLSGAGDFCAPATAPITITTSDPLVGNYDINLSNGTTTTTINAVTGSGPFTGSISSTGTWTIASVTPPAGSCPPRDSGAAIININQTPIISSVPTNATYCYLYPFDLSTLEPLIVSTPPTTHFVWYDSAVGGTEIFPYLFPNGTTTYYVAGSTGFPSNCEETTRTPVVVSVLPIPDVPTPICAGDSVTFYPSTPDCMPVPCPSGIEYSIDGFNWSTGPTFYSTDPGWAGFGSPTNSLVYIRNTAVPGCYNYVTYFSPCAAPLPTELFQFTGWMNPSNTVDLKWKTAQEKNVSHFELEKSADKSSFVKIVDIKALGNTNVVSDYTYNDKHPFNGLNYYRLKIVDVDQQYAYSNVILVESGINRSEITATYPNPVRDELTIELNVSKTERTYIQVFDALGSKVLEIPVVLDKGHQTKQLQLGSLSRGQYTIRVILNNEALVRKFVKE